MTNKNQDTIKFEALIGIGEAPCTVILKRDQDAFIVDRVLTRGNLDIAPFMSAQAHRDLIRSVIHD